MKDYCKILNEIIVAYYDNAWPEYFEDDVCKIFEREGITEGYKAEQKQGQWIDNTRAVGWPKWNCSVCGGVGRGDYKICPWCGARMDAQIGEDKSHPFAESVIMGIDEVGE